MIKYFLLCFLIKKFEIIPLLEFFPVNDINQYTYTGALGYCHFPEHGLYNFCYMDVWGYTRHVYMKRDDNFLEGIQLTWDGNPFNLKSHI